MACWLARCWRALRSITGDDAYERYLVHRAHAHPDEPPLDQRDFYLQQQRAKWSGVNRCC
jgi:uncharacterized short protein YbdD (DUF466 family)